MIARNLFGGIQRRSLILGLLTAVATLAAAGGVWAAYEGTLHRDAEMASMLPQGALLTVEAKDFSALLKQWNDAPEKAAWLKSDNYDVFSRSRLFGRLSDAQGEFASAAGLPPDLAFVQEVAGTRSIFAWYDIGKLEFLYITQLPSGSADKTRLMQMRGKFTTRQVAGQTFYVRTRPDAGAPDGSGPDAAVAGQSFGEPRTVAFATSGDWLLLSTREDLMAGALTLIAAGKAGKSSSAPDPLAKEPWFADAQAAAAQDSGAMRLTLNLEKIVPTPYFRSYWIQRNVTAMKQYRSAVADLHMDAGTFREERVLLPRAAPEDGAPGPDLSTLTALLPMHAGVYRAIASPSIDSTIASLNEKLLRRGIGSFEDSRFAPVADVAVQQTGSASDFETRIDAVADEAPVAPGALEPALLPLQQVLADSDLESMLTLSRTGEPVDGVWVPFQSAIVLSAQKDWDASAVQAALSEAIRAHLTAGGLGLQWKPVRADSGNYLELSESRPLELAVRGRLCILADNPGLISEILGRMDNTKADRKRDTASPQATVLAGFDLPEERGSFTRWSALVDRVGGADRVGGIDRVGRAGQAGPVGQVDSANGTAQSGETTSGTEPAFFSKNMASLAATFSSLEGEHMVERRDGSLTRQTVTYVWRH